MRHGQKNIKSVLCVNVASKRFRNFYGIVVTQRFNLSYLIRLDEGLLNKTAPYADCANKRFRYRCLFRD
jgi:hypothetical protein